MKTIKKKFRKFRIYWRKNGAIFLLLADVLFICFGWRVGVGIVSLLVLTVPCGVPEVNTNKALWYSRQALFFICGILLILS